MANNEYYQVRVVGDHLGKAWEHVWWIWQGTGVTNTNITDELANWFNSQIYDLLANILSDSWSVNSIIVQNWNQAAQSYILASTVVGEVVGESMPSWINATVKYSRAGAGYNYPMKRVNGLPESATDGNTLESTFATTLNAVMDNVLSITGITGSGALSYFAFGKTPPLLTTNIFNDTYRPQYPSALAGTILGTQKSRK